MRDVKMDTSGDWKPCCNHYVIDAQCANTIYTVHHAWLCRGLGPVIDRPICERLGIQAHCHCKNFLASMQTLCILCRPIPWMISPFLDDWLWFLSPFQVSSHARTSHGIATVTWCTFWVIFSHQSVSLLVLCSSPSSSFQFKFHDGFEFCMASSLSSAPSSMPSTTSTTAASPLLPLACKSISHPLFKERNFFVLRTNNSLYLRLFWLRRPRSHQEHRQRGTGPPVWLLSHAYTDETQAHYSLRTAIIAYALFCGYPSFCADTTTTISQQNANPNILESILEPVSDQAKSFIRCLPFLKLLYLLAS